MDGIEIFSGDMDMDVGLVFLILIILLILDSMMVLFMDMMELWELNKSLINSLINKLNKLINKCKKTNNKLEMIKVKLQKQLKMVQKLKSN